MNLSGKIQSLLAEVSLVAIERLDNWLPTIGGENWWKFYVYDQLSIPQQRVLQENSGNLKELDIASVLKVLSKNWLELSNHKNLTSLRPDTYKYAKEAIDIRNTLAHLSVGQDIEASDALRYVDTIKRLAAFLSSDTQILNRIEKTYKFILQSLVSIDADEEIEVEEIKLQPTNDGLEKNISLISSEPIKDAEKVLKDIYVGIDFGTSTTVVSLAQLDPMDGVLTLSPLSLEQPTEYGDFIEHHLVNSVLTKHKGKVLFGTEAARLKVRYLEGVSTFSSFKMMLGLNFPNRYPNSKIKLNNSEEYIKTPQLAATEFFKYLKNSVEKSLKDIRHGEIKYAISVPASFEANQRRDLLTCLNAAGFPIESSSLIDEPNAAFLSYLHESWQNNNEFVKNAKKTSIKTVLVFDFGAGTCDISILRLKIEGKSITSRNLAISRFMALGGDDIDRTIAKKYLLKDIKFSDSNLQLSQEEINHNVIPWLRTVAEDLKIACTNELLESNQHDILSASQLDYTATVNSPEKIIIRECEISINKPKLSMVDFVDVIKSFSGDSDFEVFDNDGDSLVGEPKSIIAPIRNALSKAGLSTEDINAILFIGGSAKNPLIRNIVTKLFPSNTEILVPKDLQTHVSKGATLHCVGFYALGQNFVHPITSEPIYLITKGANLKLIMPAGSPVPSEIPFEESFEVVLEKQSEIHLPICVSNENKLLGILKIVSPDSAGFIKGEKITLSCSITNDKLFIATACIKGKSYKVILTNPLTNGELSETDLAILEAKQRFQEHVLENDGRPTVSALLIYAEALKSAGAYLEAADQYMQIELLNSSNHSTNICFCLSQGGRAEEANKWAKIAYERKRNEVTCYNYAIQHEKDDPRYLELLQESNQYDNSFPPTLRLLGDFYIMKQKSVGFDYLNKAADELALLIKSHNATRSDCESLEKIAEKLGLDDLIELARGRKSLLQKKNSLFNEDSLTMPSRTNLIS